MHELENRPITGMSRRRSYRARIAMTVAMVMLVAGCGSSPEALPTDPTTAAFADISEDPVSEEVAAEFQAALNDMADGGGMSATVMTADGTWSGATGKADGVRDVRVDDQFAIASITKSVSRSSGDADGRGRRVWPRRPGRRLTFPADLDFDTNGATIRQLLAMRSRHPGLVRRGDAGERCQPHRQRVWSRPTSWRWSAPIALPPVRSSCTRTPTTPCSDW